MLILHLTMADGAFHLWAESDRSQAAGRRGGVGRAGARAKAHPFAAPAAVTDEEVAAALQLVEPSFEPAELICHLPSRRGGPAPSTPLLNQRTEVAGATRSRPWAVPALRLLPLDATLLLAHLGDRELLRPGVVCGSGLRLACQLFRLAASLVARQQVLPALALESRGCRAAWEPVLTGDDAQAFDSIAACAPGVLSCASANATTPSKESGRRECTHLLHHLVDSLMRLAPETNRGRPKRARSRTHATVHDAWLAALHAPSGELVLRPEQIESLRGELDEWQRFQQLLNAAPFRLSFRLEEPGEAREPEAERPSAPQGWMVRYMLQSQAEPSSLVEAGEVWQGTVLPAQGTATPSRSEVTAHLLAALGAAANLDERIRRSLEERHPAGYLTDSAGAHDFLVTVAPALQAAGFGLILPAWWLKKSARRKPGLRAKVRGAGETAPASISLSDQFELDWEVALGGEALPLEVLREMVRLKSPLVRMRDRWVTVDADMLRRAIQSVERGSWATLKEVFRMAVGAADVDGTKVMGVRAEGWLGKLLAELRKPGGFSNIAVPDGFIGTLRPYQERGYSWLAFLRRWGLGACLADDMGLGKTIQVLALIQRDRESRVRRPVLVVCPTTVLTNWRQEAHRFTPELTVLVHHGTTRLQGTEFTKAARKVAVVVTSYGLLHRDQRTLSKLRFAGAVLDEAQNIKNPATRQARAARTLKADYRIAMTGTPVENHVGELWSIMEFLNPGLLGSRKAFRERFFLPIQMSRDEEAAGRLRSLTQPFVLRRLKTDSTIAPDLPTKVESTEHCTLTKEQAALYQAVVDDVDRQMEEAQGMQRRGIILATLSKLKQVCNHPAHFLGETGPLSGRSGKLKRLAEMLEEILQVGDKALVFTQFARMGELLKTHLQEQFGREVLFLHGSTSRGARDRMVERFQTETGRESPPVLVLSLKAGGTGLNLTAASHVFHFDRWWNPAVEDQATDRAYRIGQTSNVQVHKFLCAGTFEEAIGAMIERKRGVAEQVVGSGEGWLTELSNKELRELFRLRSEDEE